MHAPTARAQFQTVCKYMPQQRSGENNNAGDIQQASAYKEPHGASASQPPIARTNTPATAYRRVPEFTPYGSVCCACAERPGLPRQSFSRTLRSQKHNIFSMGPKRRYPAVTNTTATAYLIKKPLINPSHERGSIISGQHANRSVGLRSNHIRA